MIVVVEGSKPSFLGGSSVKALFISLVISTAHLFGCLGVGSRAHWGLIERDHDPSEVAVVVVFERVDSEGHCRSGKGWCLEFGSNSEGQWPVVGTRKRCRGLVYRGEWAGVTEGNGEIRSTSQVAQDAGGRPGIETVRARMGKANEADCRKGQVGGAMVLFVARGDDGVSRSYVAASDEEYSRTAQAMIENGQEEVNGMLIAQGARKLEKLVAQLT